MLQFLAIFPLVILALVLIFSGGAYGVHHLVDWYIGSVGGYSGTEWFSYPWGWPGATIVHSIVGEIFGVDHVQAYQKIGELDFLNPVYIFLSVQGVFALTLNFLLAAAPLALMTFIVRMYLLKAPFSSGEGLMTVHKECLALLLHVGAVSTLHLASGMNIPEIVAISWKVFGFLIAAGVVIPIAMLNSASVEKESKNDKSA